MKKAVLVDVRQFVKLPKRSRSGVLPAVIRLQPLDGCLCTRGSSLDLEQTAYRRRLPFRFLARNLGPLLKIGKAELSAIFFGSRPRVLATASWNAR